MTDETQIETRPLGLAVLRIIGTSDLHGQLRGYDYDRRTALPDRGFDRAARVIAALRNGVEASVLVDAGDFLSDAREPQTSTEAPAPIVTAMDALTYDAVCPGNHDFDHGIAYLETALGGVGLPLVCSNLDAKGAGIEWPATRIVTRTLHQGGIPRPVRIGLAAFLPPATLNPPGRLGNGASRVTALDSTASKVLDRLRLDGADIIVAICHEGTRKGRPSAEIRTLVGTGEVDALIMGHRHEVFPAPDRDADRIGGVTAVLPGSHGSHVGCVDLSLEFVDGAWRVVTARATAHPVADSIPTGPAEPGEAASAVMSAGRSAHRKTLQNGERVVGWTDRPLNTHFVRIGRCRATRSVARALRRAVERSDRAGRLGDAPVVGLAAPGRGGGYGGPWNYLSIPPGPLTDHDLHRMHPHEDTVVALAATAADLVLWLERSVGALATVSPGSLAPDLVRQSHPAALFDLPDRVTFTLDLSHPPAFDLSGAPIGAPGRVRDLRLDGAPLALDAALRLAVTGHRASGGGKFPRPVPDTGVDTVPDTGIDTGERVQTALTRFFGSEEPVPDPKIFDFAAVPNAQAIFYTGPGAEDLIDDFGGGLSSIGRHEDGFHGLLLSLG